MASTFLIFGDLPPELRRMIWKFALLVPRDVVVLDSLSSYDDGQSGDHYWISKTPAPTLLQVNRESRDIGLLSYKLRLRFELKEERWDHKLRIGRWGGSSKYPKVTSFPRGIYINAEADTICCNVSSLKAFRSDDWAVIKRLKVILGPILGPALFNPLCHIEVLGPFLPALHKIPEAPYPRRIDLYAWEAIFEDVAEEHAVLASAGTTNYPAVSLRHLESRRHEKMLEVSKWIMVVYELRRERIREYERILSIPPWDL